MVWYSVDTVEHTYDACPKYSELGSFRIIAYLYVSDGSRRWPRQSTEKKYSVFIYSEAEPHAMYAIYKQMHTLCVLQYLIPALHTCGWREHPHGVPASLVQDDLLCQLAIACLLSLPPLELLLQHLVSLPSLLLLDLLSHAGVAVSVSLLHTKTQIIKAGN